MDKNEALQLLERTRKLYGSIHYQINVLSEIRNLTETVKLYMDPETIKRIEVSDKSYTLIRGDWIGIIPATIYTYLCKASYGVRLNDTTMHFCKGLITWAIKDNKAKLLSVDSLLCYRNVAGIEINEFSKLEIANGYNFLIKTLLKQRATVFLMDFGKGIVDENSHVALKKFGAELHRLNVEGILGSLILSSEDINNLPEDFVNLFDVVDISENKQVEERFSSVQPIKNDTESVQKESSPPKWFIDEEIRVIFCHIEDKRYEIKLEPRHFELFHFLYKTGIGKKVAVATILKEKHETFEDVESNVKEAVRKIRIKIKNQLKANDINIEGQIIKPDVEPPKKITAYTLLNPKISK